MEPKWLYRLESTNEDIGLWYNSKGQYSSVIEKLQNCKTKELPMGYDVRYKIGNKDWYSSCSKKEDLTYWYSIENARELLQKGFRFSKYLAVDYIEYEKETTFLKETCLIRVTLNIEEVFHEGDKKNECI